MGGGSWRDSGFASAAAGTGACVFAVISCVTRGIRLLGWTALPSSPPASSWGPAARGAASPSRLAEHFSSLLSCQQLEIWKSGLVHGAEPAFVPPFVLPQTKRRCREYVSPSQCPADVQQIPVWLGPVAFASFTPFERGHVQMRQQAGASCGFSPNTIPPREGLDCFSLAFGTTFHPCHPHGCRAERSSCLTAAPATLHGDSWAF